MTDRQPLNQFLEALAGLCAEQRAAEKWLIAPSRRIGRQWTDALARHGVPVLNLRIKTLRALALDLASPAIACQGLALVRGHRLHQIVARLLAGQQGQQDGYLSRLPPSPGLLRVLEATLSDLRLAGLRAADLDADRCEVRSKGRELRRLLEAYERTLQQRGLVDLADALRLACERLESGDGLPGADALVLRPDDEPLAGLELRLWQAIPEQQRRSLAVDPPARAAHGRLQMFRAAGEACEVREVLRRCLDEDLPLDRIELVHTDAEAYVPTVLELLASSAQGRDRDLPVTFGEGLPVRLFRPGRALLAWVGWARSGLPQRTLQQMIGDGLLRPEPARSGPSFAWLARTLRAVPVFQGRARYRPALEAEVRACRFRLTQLAGEIHDAEELARRRQGLQDRIERLDAVTAIVARLLDCTPEDRSSDSERILEQAQRFLERCVRVASRLDEYSRDALAKHVRELRDALAEDGAPPGFDAWDWLASLPAALSVGGEAPAPGKLHVSALDQGGHSGRPRLFVLGLDDGRFPGAGLQDPLLLDAERARIDPALPRAAERLAERSRRLLRLLARQRGEVTLSFSCLDLVDSREGFASPALLPLFRELCRTPDADLEAFHDWLGPAAGMAPRSEASCLDPGEWWLWRAARALPARLDPEAPARCIEFLGRGLQARLARASDRFTEYDGYVPAAGEAFDAEAPVSASRLEVLGRCPLEYFLSRVLGIAPPEEHDLDPSVWLDALARGDLLHTVFREFMTRLAGDGPVRPVFERDRPLLEALLAERIAEQRQALPPPSEDVLAREHRELLSTALIFLQEEERAAALRLPYCFEAAIGLPPEGGGTPLDSPEPEAIALPGGERLRVRGRIDRIDDAAPDSPGRRFFVWDYKTGSASGYDPRDPLQGGRRVQGPLYLALAEARLNAVLGPSARVEGFGYFFPGTRAHGERISWQASELASGRAAIARLVSMLRCGCFPFSDQLDDVRFSDYRDALGAGEPLAEQTRSKLRNRDNQALAPFRELRGHGDDDA